MSNRMDVNRVMVKRMEKLDGPTNPIVSPLLTDLYQFTMAYAYWKAGKHLERAVFDLFFRKNPFGGEYTIFAGLEECIRFIANFRLEEEEITFLRSVLPSTCDAGFFDYLEGVDCSDVEVYAIPEGSAVFPKVPLLRVEGPVALVQLLETPFLNLINYGSLVATNAARHRMVTGKSKVLLEFGLRRAQGPDGGISASKYCYIGGFDATRGHGISRILYNYTATKKTMFDYDQWECPYDWQVPTNFRPHRQSNTNQQPDGRMMKFLEEPEGQGPYLCTLFF